MPFKRHNPGCPCCETSICNCSKDGEEIAIYMDIDVTVLVESFWVWGSSFDQPDTKNTNKESFSVSVPLKRICKETNLGLQPFFRGLDDAFLFYAVKDFRTVEIWVGSFYVTIMLDYEFSTVLDGGRPDDLAVYFSKFLSINPGDETNFCVIGLDMREYSWVVQNATLPGESFDDRREMTILTGKWALRK